MLLAKGGSSMLLAKKDSTEKPDMCELPTSDLVVQELVQAQTFGIFPLSPGLGLVEARRWTDW